MTQIASLLVMATVSTSLMVHNICIKYSPREGGLCAKGGIIAGFYDI